MMNLFFVGLRYAKRVTRRWLTTTDMQGNSCRNISGSAATFSSILVSTTVPSRGVCVCVRVCMGVGASACFLEGIR